ncbi:Double-stranded DNA-binding domain containing protein [Entamoeba marina]
MSNQQAQQQYKQQQMREQEERRQQLLTSVLEADAKERLASISLVKPEKARQVEDMIMLMCGLISLIDQINENKTETKVTIVHKKDDDFDDLDIDDL